GARFDGRIGPTFNYEITRRGQGPESLDYISWDGVLRIMSHPYEAFTRDQAEGWVGTLNFSGLRKGINSPFNVSRYDGDLKYLWNIRKLSPPLWVLATRLAGSATDF